MDSDISTLAEPVNGQHLDKLLKPLLEFDFAQRILYVCDELRLHTLNDLLRRAKVLDETARVVRKRITEVLEHLDTDHPVDWGMFMIAKRKTKN